MPRIAGARKYFWYILLGECVFFLILGGILFATMPSEPGNIAIILGSFLFVAVVLWLVMRPLLREQAIAETGRPALATLQSYWDTGTTLNDDPQVGMHLEVRPHDRPPFEAKIKTYVSRLEVGKLNEGAEVVVVYDPQNLEKIAFISFEAPPELKRLYPAPVETPAPAVDERRQGRLAELDELRSRSMLSETDYQRRRKELEALDRSGS